MAPFFYVTLTRRLSCAEQRLLTLVTEIVSFDILALDIVALDIVALDIVALDMVSFDNDVIGPISQITLLPSPTIAVPCRADWSHPLAQQ